MKIAHMKPATRLKLEELIRDIPQEARRILFPLADAMGEGGTGEIVFEVKLSFHAGGCREPKLQGNCTLI